MGYSISVRFPSLIVQEKVLNFLGENYRDWENLTGQKFAGAKFVEECETLAYAPRDYPTIGFNYSGGTIGIDYAWRICTWMAVLIQNHFKDCDHCIRRVDCLPSSKCLFAAVNYDGCEDYPIEEFEDIDETGFFPLSFRKREWLSITDPEQVGSFNQIVKDELKRLTELWQGQNP